MIHLPESYLKVHYGLRPAKQVERRMFIESFQLLAESGFPIRDYKYIGMGSVHFIDFALFHKYLGIKKMLSVEYSGNIKNRVKFNLPYKEIIDIEVGEPIGNYLSDLSKESNHLIWLDYDNVLSEFMIRDIALALNNLSSGSILLATVDTEPPQNISKDDSSENLKKIKDYYYSYFQKYVYKHNKLSDFQYENLPRINIDIIHNLIRSEMNVRDETFQLLYNFLYSDGHRMLTIGGLILNKKDKRKLKSELLSMDYIITDFKNDSYFIYVPRITRKEQLYLDSFMPCSSDWNPSDFELEKDDLEAYRKIYRYYPTYAELLL